MPVTTSTSQDVSLILRLLAALEIPVGLASMTSTCRGADGFQGKASLSKAGSIPLWQVALVWPEDLAILPGKQLWLSVLRRVAINAVEVVAPCWTLLLLHRE